MVKWLHPVSVAYAATSLGAALMNSVFMFYYVKVFLNRHHVSESWFQVSQVIFMIWNALNDPLFGYMQDNYNIACLKIRRLSILYGAPFFAISFLVPWFPWGDYSEPTWLAGVQLTFALCFYDTLFTFVLLAQCALFAEISHHQADRIRLVRYWQVAGLVGSTSVFFSNYFSDNLTDYVSFQWTTIVIAILSLVALVYSGLYTHSDYDKAATETLHSAVPAAPPSSIWRQGFQILFQRNALSFILMNFLQVLHVTWLSNFTGIICDSLIPDTEISPAFRSTFYGSLFVIPHVSGFILSTFLPNFTLNFQIIVIIGAPLVSSIGYYTIISYSFYVKILFGLILFMGGPVPWILITTFLIQRYYKVSHLQSSIFVE
jgi:Na+/melibiose symporter-like transporter